MERAPHQDRRPTASPPTPLCSPREGTTLGGTGRVEVNPEAKYAFGRDRAAVPLLRRNPWLSGPPGRDGPGRDDFPCLPSRAPFRWLYLDRAFDMEFAGGLVGVRQD